MKKRLFLLVIVVLVGFALPGCMGSTDINNLAMVMAVAIDKGSSPGMVKLTAQIVRPADAVGQTGAPAGGTGEPIWTASAEGKSLFEAIRNLNRFASRKVYWAHNNVIVISAAIATQGIQDIVDFFARNHELRMRTWVVITSQEASEIVTAKTGLQVIPGESIDQLMRYSRVVAEAPKIDMRQLLADYLSPTNEVILPRVELKQRGDTAQSKHEFGTSPQVELAGTAYFHGDRLAGWLTPQQSQGLLWFVEPPQSRLMVVACPDDVQKKVTLEIKNSHFSVIPKLNQAGMTFQLVLKGTADMVESQCAMEKSNTMLMHKLEQEAENKLAANLLDVVHLEQKQHVDFLQLGQTFRQKYPAEWTQMHADGQWIQRLSMAQIQLSKVHIHIHSPVLLQTPTRKGALPQ